MRGGKNWNQGQAGNVVWRCVLYPCPCPLSLSLLFPMVEVEWTMDVMDKWTTWTKNGRNGRNGQSGLVNCVSSRGGQPDGQNGRS